MYFAVHHGLVLKPFVKEIIPRIYSTCIERFIFLTVPQLVPSFCGKKLLQYDYHK